MLVTGYPFPSDKRSASEGIFTPNPLYLSNSSDLLRLGTKTAGRRSDDCRLWVGRAEIVHWNALLWWPTIFQGVPGWWNRCIDTTSCCPVYLAIMRVVFDDRFNEAHLRLLKYTFLIIGNIIYYFLRDVFYADCWQESHRNDIDWFQQSCTIFTSRADPDNRTLYPVWTAEHSVQQRSANPSRPTVAHTNNL